MNVIPLNPTPGVEVGRRAEAGGASSSSGASSDQGVACTVRDTRGQEIAAACGQLAAEG